MKQTWFEQMFLSWTGCPALEGDFETGCHTFEANNLVLFMIHTRKYNEWYHQIIESTWEFFSRHKNTGIYGTQRFLFPKEGIEKKLRYDILCSGIAVPTYIGRHTWPKVKQLYKALIIDYERETGEKAAVDDATIRDVQNWIMRELSVWLNENKRY